MENHQKKLKLSPIAGTTLVELLVTVAIGGIVSLAIYETMKTQNQAQWLSDSLTNINEDREEIAMISRRKIPAYARETASNLNQNGMVNGKITFNSPTMNTAMTIEVVCESSASDPIFKLLASDISNKMIPTPYLNTNCASCASGTRARTIITMTDSSGNTKIKNYPRNDIGVATSGGKYGAGLATNTCVSAPLCSPNGKINTCTSWSVEILQAYLTKAMDKSWLSMSSISNFMMVAREKILLDTPDQLGQSINLINK